MTQKDKELLLKDICARLPYGVIIAQGPYDKNPIKLNSISITSIGTFFNGYFTEGINFTFNGKGDIWPKPYLRSMQNMTEEEKINYITLTHYNKDENNKPYRELTIEAFDWLNSNHFDYNGLIKKGLAIEVDKNFYK